ncbi:hypothetical protein Sme01_55530 [Sphaerisporangium melleum]|uniref:Novel STAND NTPase 1 domain-containing protein n=1 Tax=Sphaerisporangium melleum TaxID=321316 RepID=A0A917RQ49_9ACTN|nr:tetratricopeptide repeat protein [Sphaerisporangium melleum]GGL18092.1 hypothetical protein GCM10007964_70150 [Sphaerisporangium melleum]GII73077.1 hypothetical protein Sme01_55530 [Sphaerisporangium melleum]
MDSSGTAHRAKEPYVGPRSFTRRESHLFFGRDRERHELVDLWQANRLTILSGPAGVGKSSLLEAGVLPLLDPGKTAVLPTGGVTRRRTIPVAVLSPGANPHVFALLTSWAPFSPPAQLAETTIADFLRHLPARTDPYGDPLLTMLAIDHLENLFADLAWREPHSEAFLGELVAALEASPHARLLIVVSDDHLPSILSYGELAAMAKARFPLAALGVRAALSACRRPLQGAGRSFAPGAAEELVDDLRRVRLGGPGEEVTLVRDTVEPVHLQLACAGLWRSLPDDHTVVTGQDVRAASPDRALTEFCDHVLREVARDHFHGETEKLRLRLRQVFLDDARTPRRVQRGVTETSGLPDAVVRTLADRHILRLGPGGRVRLASDRLAGPLLRNGPAGHDAERPGPAALLHVADLALSEGRLDGAVKHAEEALRHAGGDARLQAEIEVFLGDVHYLGDRVAEAITHYRLAVRHLASLRGTDGAIATLFAALAQAQLRRGDLAAALTELRSAITRNPGDLGVRVKLAWALWQGGRPQAALDAIDEAIDLGGDVSAAIRARGEMRADLGAAAPALRDLERTLPHHSPAARAAYALALALNDEVAAAGRAVPPVEEERDASVLLRVARVMSLTGREQEAAQLAGRARLPGGRPPLPAHLTGVAERLTTLG